MTDLRRYAKGKECMIRLEGICNFDPATTVLAHFRLPGVSGLGVRASDVCASWACSACHDACDRRSHMELERDFVRLALLEGVMRTQSELVRQKVLKW
jgi:Protein of unknown function (DUF1364)